MTAAGPYTEANNLSYAPLEDLLSKVLTNKPDLLVLMGPFVDTSQEVLASGDMVRIMFYVLPLFLLFVTSLSLSYPSITAYLHFLTRHDV